MTRLLTWAAIAACFLIVVVLFVGAMHEPIGAAGGYR